LGAPPSTRSPPRPTSAPHPPPTTHHLHTHTRAHAHAHAHATPRHATPRHAGTIKLLLEGIIATLRAEGRATLEFGFAPFFNLRDDRGWRHLRWIRWALLATYAYGNNL
jgi:hypothetical protein